MTRLDLRPLGIALTVLFGLNSIAVVLIFTLDNPHIGLTLGFVADIAMIVAGLYDPIWEI